MKIREKTLLAIALLTVAQTTLSEPLELATDAQELIRPTSLIQDTNQNLTTTFYHAGIFYNLDARRMSRVAIFSKNNQIEKMIFTRMDSLSISPTYQIVLVDFSNADLSKSGSGLLTGKVTESKFPTNFYKFGANDDTFGRVFQVRWVVNQPKSLTDDPQLVIPSTFYVNVTGVDEVKLTDFYEVDPPFGRLLEVILSGVIGLGLLVVFVLLWRESTYYKQIFVYMAPKISIYYMLIGDVLMAIHSLVFDQVGSIVPQLISLFFGLVFAIRIYFVTNRHDGFKSPKMKLSFFATLLMGGVSCLGFYGDNFFMEICYCFFPLMIIMENLYLDILHFNKLINLCYIPLKISMVFMGICINNGWWLDISYIYLLIVLVSPLVLSILAHCIDRRYKPGFYKKLSGKEMEIYSRRLKQIEIMQEISEKMRKEGAATLVGDALLMELAKGDDQNPRCAVCLGLVRGGGDEEFEGMEDDDLGPVKKTRCGHYFHQYCLDDWLSKKDTCPLCRTKIKGEEVE